jgi:hypothetical protein
MKESKLSAPLFDTGGEFLATIKLGQEDESR